MIGKLIFAGLFLFMIVGLGIGGTMNAIESGYDKISSGVLIHDTRNEVFNSIKSNFTPEMQNVLNDTISQELK